MDTLCALGLPLPLWRLRAPSRPACSPGLLALLRRRLPQTLSFRPLHLSLKPSFQDTP